jgi:hypothetical protein
MGIFIGCGYGSHTGIDVATLDILLGEKSMLSGGGIFSSVI